MVADGLMVHQELPAALGASFNDDLKTVDQVKLETNPEAEESDYFAQVNRAS